MQSHLLDTQWREEEACRKAHGPPELEGIPDALDFTIDCPPYLTAVRVRKGIGWPVVWEAVIDDRERFRVVESESIWETCLPAIGELFSVEAIPRPTDRAGEVYRARLTLTTNDPRRSVRNIALSMTIPKRIVLSRELVDFGRVPLGQRRIRVLDLQNCSDVTLQVHLERTGGDAPEIEARLRGLEYGYLEYASTAKGAIEVAFSPQRRGPSEAEFAVTARRYPGNMEHCRRQRVHFAVRGEGR